MKKPFTERVGEWFREHMKIPRGVIIALCIFPAVITALFYILRPIRGVMDWFALHVSSPLRGFFGMLSSIYPLALTEVFLIVAVVLLVYYIVKAIRDSSRRRKKWSLLGKRFLGLLVVVCYFYSAFCWLWSSGYYAAGFAEKSGFTGGGVATGDLAAVTQLFADKANELSVQLDRDEDGSLIFNRSEVFEQSEGIYRNISGQFPALKGTVYAPKPMYIFSWLMTITGYTGVYFALTGESMVNTQQHAAYMPATVAHELAHQLGVYAEDEANFAGILACVTSENAVYEYAGYISGLGYLSNALYRADSDEYFRIMSGLAPGVVLDRSQNAEFWARATSSDFGIEFIDNILSSLKKASNTVVDNVYDNYLKAQDQELGLQTYGKCVDLLVEYFK